MTDHRRRRHRKGQALKNTKDDPVLEDAAEQVRSARKALPLLTDALTLLESPRSWTRKGYALDGRGRQVRVDDPRARRFCIVGAVLRAEHDRNETPMPVATDPSPYVDDLKLPVALGAPPHVTLALQVLGVVALEQLHAFGLTVRQLTDQPLSLPHLPLLLGLHRSTGHSTALAVLLKAIACTAELASATTPASDNSEQPTPPARRRRSQA